MTSSGLGHSLLLPCTNEQKYKVLPASVNWHSWTSTIFRLKSGSFQFAHITKSRERARFHAKGDNFSDTASSVVSMAEGLGSTPLQTKLNQQHDTGSNLESFIQGSVPGGEANDIMSNKFYKSCFDVSSALGQAPKLAWQDAWNHRRSAT